MISRATAVFVALIFSAALAANAAAPQLRAKKTISLAGAKKMAAAAEAEAVKNGLTVTIAIVDDGGHLVYLERMDGAPFNTMEVTQEKAVTAAGFNQPTKFFKDQVTTGGAGNGFLSLPEVRAMAGAYPIVVQGEEVGAISVGGAMDAFDEQCAKAGIAALTMN